MTYFLHFLVTRAKTQIFLRQISHLHTYTYLAHTFFAIPTWQNKQTNKQKQKQTQNKNKKQNKTKQNKKQNKTKTKQKKTKKQKQKQKQTFYHVWLSTTNIYSHLWESTRGLAEKCRTHDH